MRPPFIYILNDLISRGEVNAARRELKRLNLSRVKRAEAGELASLSRRAGVPEIGLKILAPIVLRKKLREAPAVAAEKTEYAFCLSRIGAIEEAEFFIGMTESSTPAALLCRAAICVQHWRYEESIPLLKEYIGKSQVTEYQRIVAEVNLSAAYVAMGHWDESSRLLLGLEQKTWKKKALRLHSNVLELLAEVALFQGETQEMETWLKRAESISRMRDDFDALFVAKMRAIGDAKLKGSWKGLEEVRIGARKIGHWETLRDCDRWEAQIRNDRKMFLYLYFGSPHEAYRQQILREFGERIEIPDHFVWQLGEKKSVESLDLVSLSDEALSRGKTLHRILGALCKDFYRPLPYATLFQWIFPGEHYSADAASSRMKVALSRLRRWIKSRDLPLSVENVGQAFRLHSSGPLAIRVPRTQGSRSQEWMVKRLREEFLGDTFSAADAARVCGISPRTSRRNLEEARREGLVDRRGKARQTRWFISETSERGAA